MLTAALRALVDRISLKNEKIGEVAAGAVIKHSKDWNLARESVLGAGLHPTTPAYDLQRACGTSLSALAQLGNRIALRRDRLGHRRRRRQHQRHSAFLRQATPADPADERAGPIFRRTFLPWQNLRFRDLKPLAPGIAEPRTGLSMGEHCEEMAKEWKIGRARAGRARAGEPSQCGGGVAGRLFRRPGLSFPRKCKRDNNVRADTTLEKLASLKPAFDRSRGNAHRGQQLAAHRRRGQRAARRRRNGRGRAASAAMLSHFQPKRRRWISSAWRGPRKAC